MSADLKINTQHSKLLKEWRLCGVECTHAYDITRMKRSSANFRFPQFGKHSIALDQDHLRFLSTTTFVVSDDSSHAVRLAWQSNQS